MKLGSSHSYCACTASIKFVISELSRANILQLIVTMLNHGRYFFYP